MDQVSDALRLQAFRAVDTFAVEAYRATAPGQASDPTLREGLRRAASRAGAAVVAASMAPPGHAGERSWLARAREHLAEARYHVYLARRVGIIEARTYRALAARHDAAQRQLAALLDGPASPESGAPRHTAIQAAPASAKGATPAAVPRASR